MNATDVSSETKSDAVRISNIAGRYLIFDPDAVAVLRRQENTNGTLVGTTPQQPTQNIFLGLPVELRVEEAYTLVQKGSAYIVDDAASHITALNSANTEARMMYVDFLRQSKHAARLALAERTASRAVSVTSRPEQSKGHIRGPSSSEDHGSHAVATEVNACPDGQKSSTVGLLASTPVSSNVLLPLNTLRACTMQVEPEASLCQFLQASGNYMTPGLRFGAQYSVYPGDPLRFHAHFMANQYGWDECIPILDLVGGGRLATAVKKAFLIGGQEPASGSHHSSIRTYSVEWAAM